MISPPHKHDVLKNKKPQSVSSKLPGAYLNIIFFFGGGVWGL